MQKVIRGYYKQLYTKKLDDLEEMVNIQLHTMCKTQEEINSLNRLITISEIESVIKKKQTNLENQFQDQKFSQQNSINIQLRANTCPSQTIPKC